jgi:hypothetical protein
MRLGVFACVMVCGGTSLADPAGVVWPQAVVHDGETEGKTMFGAEQRWISPDGEPVLFVHVLRGDGKGVLRAVHRDGGKDVAQDVLVHAFGKDEMVVIARDDGELGFQFHSYATHPNKYLGVRATWKDHAVAIAKQQAFTGYDPTPAWLFDPDAKGPVAAWRAMRSGALDNNNMNGFSHWFDDGDVAITRDGKKSTMSGTAFLAHLDTLPMLGNHGVCDATGCCHGDTAALAAYTHVESVCFSTGDSPHVRTIEIASPTR